MAFKMAVRAWDVLEQTRICETLGEALRAHDVSFATTARRGQKGLHTPREAARIAREIAAEARRVAVVFGNEKTGLSATEVDLCERRIRIPMAADQPSINLAQACQLVAYEWFVTGMETFGASS